MAALLIEPSDVIDVSFVPVLIYGPPGSGKTSLAQTAENPLTLDFDEGVHRSFNRKPAVRFQSWVDVIQAGTDGMFQKYDTLVMDTGGRALDLIIPLVIAENAKHSYAGSLSPQGWGVLGNRFTTWLKTIRALRKQVVMVCHQEESKDASGNSFFLPDLPGKMSWKDIHKNFDLIGRIRYEGRTRILDFNPSDNAIGKNAAGWEAKPLPALESSPLFLAELIADAKAKIGQIAQASAKAASVTDEWATWLASDPTLDQINAKVPEVGNLKGAVKKQVWHLVQEHGEKCGLAFDAAKKAFTRKEVAA